MKLLFLVLPNVCLSVLGASQPLSDAAQRMLAINSEYIETTTSNLPSGSCTSENIAIRHAWDDLSEAQQADYVRAVQCLQASPPKSNTTVAHSRYEEFVLSHISQTLKIHFSGLLLPWHRYFLWLYEKALRDECGYQGYQPYWDWPKHVEEQTSSLFSGSAHSLGGDGKAIPHGLENHIYPGGPPPASVTVTFPGTGGGCVEDGPFANYTLILDATNDGASTPIQISDNPRCLTRDFNLTILADQNSYQNVTDLVLLSDDVEAFRGRYDAERGIHIGGHSFIGGENFNQFTSPHDAAFYFHHAMFDRVWAIWQSRDLESRSLALSGTLTWGDYPPTPNVSVTDFLDMDLLGTIQIQDIMSPVEGPLCYRYE